ncbi:MAG: tetratricopeptide (TPR) repeat protein [Flavobacteriaceae bacterium]|jgi:tetratricopeptide (TPR) repeat protein
MLKKARIYIIICVVALFQYGNTFEHDYAWDDVIVITQNERVQEGLGNPSNLFRNIKGDEVQYRYGYRPISLLSFALDIELSEMTPKTGHVMNVLYYALLCCLIFYFLRRMFPEKGTLFSIIIVGLFLIHPVHTEVVANIKSRDEILTMIFGITSMIFFLNFLERQKHNYLFGALTILALLLSFLSKENGITFAGILLLLAYFKSSDRIKPYLKYSLPILGGAALIALRLYVYSDSVFENNATELLESLQYREDAFLGNPLHDASGLMQIIPNVFNILIKNLGLLVFPITLVHDYGFSHSTIVSWTDPLVIVSVVFHLALLYVVIREFKKKSVLLFGILFYFITLSVYLHIIQVGPDYMGERFLFISSLGFLIAVVALIERIAKASFNSDAEPIWKNQKAKVTFGVLGLFFILGFGKTTNRNEAWENNRTLLETDIEVLDDCARTQYNYACLLHADYYKSPSLGKADRILHYYQRAVDLSPRSMKAMLDLGSAYMEFGYPEKGKEVFENCKKQHPGLAAPLMQLAKFYMGQEDFQNALNFYTKTGEHTKLSEVNHGKAICLFKLGKTEKAISELVAGVKYNPQNPEYFELLSDLQFTMNHKTESIQSLDEAIRLAPNNQSLKVKRLARD